MEISFILDQTKLFLKPINEQYNVVDFVEKYDWFLWVKDHWLVRGIHLLHIH